MGDSLFGTTTQRGQALTSPSISDLWGMRGNVANAVFSGQFPSSGFFNNILIPSTMNKLTAAGLGRSGAVGESVSNAVLGQGIGLLEAMLTGIPSPFGPVTTQKTSRTAGTADILGTIGGALGGLGPFIPAIGNALFGESFSNPFGGSGLIPGLFNSLFGGDTGAPAVSFASPSGVPTADILRDLIPSVVEPFFSFT